MIANKYTISLFNIFVNLFLKFFLNFFKKFIVYSTNTVITVFSQNQISNYLSFLYNKQNMKHLNQSIQNVKEGKTTLKEHEKYKIFFKIYNNIKN